MVKGLEVFKNHFKEFSDKYVLIGGTACSLAMEDAGLDFRATEDLDIVLHVEALDVDFVTAFWAFVKAGEYEIQQKSSGEPKFYRFINPKNDKYPKQLELFSRKPDILGVPDDARFAPIPVDEDLSSLSAILLDDGYYSLIQLGTVDIGGLSVVKPEYLIPLKIRAWMDLKQRKEDGERVNSTDVKKHRNDVFRLVQIIEPTTNIPIEKQVRDDIRQGLELLEAENNIDQTSSQLAGRSTIEVTNILKKVYGIS